MGHPNTEQSSRIAVSEMLDPTLGAKCAPKMGLLVCDGAVWVGIVGVEKQISPLRCSQRREQLRSKMTAPGLGGVKAVRAAARMPTHAMRLHEWGTRHPALMWVLVEEKRYSPR